MHSISVWNFAQSPNYVTNVDIIYPYSEVPYIGNYKLVKIPISTNKLIVPASELIDHVDYWGEGRINTSVGSSGFPNCYNVNHQYQLVSNGTDRDRKIPNKIPVISYTDCNTSSYIKDNTVKLVTLMGAPINKSCAQDIARMVNADFGQVVVYGFGSDAKDTKNLEEELAKRKLLFCHGFKLSELLKSITLFGKEDHRVYLNITDLGAELYRNVVEAAYIDAVYISKTLEASGNSVSIVHVVNKMLKEGKRNVMAFAYHLWNNDAQSMVTNYFPVSFKLILNQEYVKIMSKTNMFTVKLDTNLESDNERIAYGDEKDKDSAKLRWKVVPLKEDNVIFFKILNVENEMCLKLEDKAGAKIAKGSTSATERRSQWFLDPIKVDDDMLFFIINKEHNQGLKLDEVAESNGDKKIIGHNGAVYGEPLKYGWYIAPWQ